MVQAEQRLAQQQHVYDTIRAERNATAKQLLDLRDDIAGMRCKFKSMVRMMVCCMMTERSYLLKSQWVNPHFLGGPLFFSPESMCYTNQRTNYRTNKRTNNVALLLQHHHMEQLKEECRAKDLGLAQQQFAGQQSERERASLAAAAARLQKEVVELEGRRLSQRLETNKLAAAAATAAQVCNRAK